MRFFLFVSALVASSVSFAHKRDSCKSNGSTFRIACTVDCPQSYKDALNAAAEKLGYTIEIGTLKNEKDLKNYDAFLSPGGHDIDPIHYTANLTPEERKKIEDLHKRKGNGGKPATASQLERDRKEQLIMDEYLKDHGAYRTMPFLGVCYGMQAMAAAHGIPLKVDIEEQLGIPAQRSVHNTIDLNESSVLKAYNGNRASLPGFKNHHQAIDMEYFAKHGKSHKTVKITGTSHEGKIAEVMELTNRPALGIQFHAERTTEDDVAKLAPYEFFLEKTCARVTRVSKKSSASPAVASPGPQRQK